jgi:hypothetical protein
MDDEQPRSPRRLLRDETSALRDLLETKLAAPSDE